MILGAIVRYEGHSWRVFKLDRNVRTATLMRWGGSLQEIADDDTGAIVVADPSMWPVVTARVKTVAGPLVRLSLARRGRSRDLEPLAEWVPSDMTRAGGSIFVSPGLKLQVGEILVAGYTNGSALRIVITKRYGTMAQRMVRQSAVPRKKSLMDFLDGDDLVE